MPQRIMIFGRPGSGKSTFALKLHRLTGLPLHHLDCHFWQENWAKRDYEEFMNIQYELVERDRWIIDGTQIKSLMVRYERAQVCIYFNIPRWRCMWRLCKRLWHKDPELQDRAPGCTDRISKSFWTLLKYAWHFEQRVGQSLALLQEAYPEVQFVEIRSDKEAKNLLSSFKEIHTVSSSIVQKRIPL